MKTYCEHFTPRQVEVVKLIYEEGLSNKEIGERLNFAPSTIKGDLNKMFDICGVKGRFRLAIRLKEEGCF